MEVNEYSWAFFSPSASLLIPKSTACFTSKTAVASWNICLPVHEQEHFCYWSLIWQPLAYHQNVPIFFFYHKKVDPKFINLVVVFPDYVSNSMWMNYHVSILPRQNDFHSDISKTNYEYHCAKHCRGTLQRNGMSRREVQRGSGKT